MTMRWIVRDKSFYRALVALAVPICFQNALTCGVALDTLRQMESLLVMRHYDGFLKHGRIQSRMR